MRILMWTVIAIVAAAAFVAVGTAYAAGYGVPPAAAPGARGTPGAPAQYYGYSGPGMMGYYGGYAAGYGYYGGYIPIGSAMAAEATPLPGATAVSSNDTVELEPAGGTVDVAAYAMMPDMAENLTGARPPAYSSGDVFVIDGEINPTLVIRSPGPVRLNITLVNLDDDMYHNLVVTAEPPPYGYYPMSAMMGQPSMHMVPFLPPANYSSGIAQYYTYGAVLPGPGIYWYLCTYPGHAQEGMYGEILVEP